MADRYGKDQESYPFDGTGRAIEGVDVLVRDAYKRLRTRAAALWWAPAATRDVRELLQAPLGVQSLDQEQEALTRLFDDDPRAEYAVRLVWSAGELTCELTIEPTDGDPLTAVILADGTLEVR